MALGMFIISTFKTLEAVATKIGNGVDAGTVVSSAETERITANQNAITSINTMIDSHSETIDSLKGRIHTLELKATDTDPFKATTKKDLTNLNPRVTAWRVK